MYGPETLFVAGFTWVGICNIICGFAVNGPMLFVFRAFQGIGRQHGLRLLERIDATFVLTSGS